VFLGWPRDLLSAGGGDLKSATIFGGGGAGPVTGSAWAPFRHRLFAAMWGAQFVSNVGGWMQTVAAVADADPCVPG
jgi:hypothetical protein